MAELLTGIGTVLEYGFTMDYFTVAVTAARPAPPDPRDHLRQCHSLAAEACGRLGNSQSTFAGSFFSRP